MMKMDHLQAEMDALNAKMKGKEELSKIDKAIEIMRGDSRLDKSIVDALAAMLESQQDGQSK